MCTICDLMDTNCSRLIWKMLLMFIRNLILNAAIMFISTNVYAQQWTSVGDASLRRDVDLLKTYGIVEGPVNTWPLSWRQITNNINMNLDQSYPSHVERAISRVMGKIPDKGLRGSATLRATNEPQLIRGFSNVARSDADLSASLGLTEEKIDANVTVNYRNEVNFDNSNVNFDGSYIATNLGNVSLYAGAIDRWWGPGQENTLLVSSNARPMVSAGLRRIDPKPFKTKWLSWMGPWTWDMFVAHMGNDRHIPNALMAGMRLGFEPVKNFEIGLSRTMQLCGSGRPCGFDAWARSIIGVWDLDNTGTADEPGNQLASIDLSYSFNINDHNIRLYIEGTAEDEWKILPYQYSRLLGSSLVTPIGENGDTLKFNIELSDSGGVERWFYGRRYLGTMYNHFIYRSGHRFDNRTLGHSLDSGSKLASFKAEYVNSSGDTIEIILTRATINWDQTTRNIISSTSQKYSKAELRATKKISFGDLQASISLQSKAITLTQGILPKFTGNLIWSVGF
ncbi:capsule assembly Wzi family protein [Emcibacteraceae bacterium]|nr:capsule assembly Wzi family protein [Emcibacteraceae bacterium]